MTDGVDLGIAGLGPATRIGSGGNAFVYRARQPELDRTVAIKVLKQADDDTRRRFDRERRAMGRLGEHDGVVSVYSTGFTEFGNPYLVMPLLPASLDDEIRADATLPWTDAVAITSDVCTTVQFAHDEGVIHRDLKPANLMRNARGRVLVSDFGIARITTGSASLASVALQLTPMYSPPEAFDGEQASPAFDIYSLGATLYALVSGHPPFVEPGESVSFLGIMQRINELPVPPLAPAIPAGLDAVLARALAKRPDDRYSSAAEMSFALDSLLPSPDTTTRAAAVTAAQTPPPLPAIAPTEPIAAGTQRVPDEQPQPSRRGRGLVVASLFVALVAVVGFLVWTTQDDGTEEPTATSASTALDDGVVTASTLADAVVSGSVAAGTTAPSDGDADPSPVDVVALADTVGPGARVEGFRLERTEGPFAVGTADGDGGRELVLIDRGSLSEVARTPLEPGATNTTDAVLTESGQLWVSISGQDSIAVYEPGCGCIDRREPVANGEVRTLVPLDDRVWAGVPAGSGERLVGYSTAGGVMIEVAPPTGVDSQLWRGLLVGRLVMVGDAGVALFDETGSLVAGPFPLSVQSPDANELEATSFVWTDPVDGTVHELAADGDESSLTVADPGSGLSAPAYDDERELYWMIDPAGPWLIGVAAGLEGEPIRSPLGSTPAGAAPKLGGGLVWLATAGSIVGVDPMTGLERLRIETVGDAPPAFDATDDQVWVVDPLDPSAVTRYQLSRS